MLCTCAHRYVGGTAADSDKGAGVVGLVMFDLRRRGKVASRLAMCGVNGAKFPGIRAHMQRNIGKEKNQLEHVQPALKTTSSGDTFMFVQ